MLSASLSGFLALVFVIAFVVALIVLPLFWVASYAQEKGREPLPWVLLSLFVSPFAVLLLLWLLPPADGFRRGPGIAGLILESDMHYLRGRAG